MLTSEVNESLIGKRVTGIYTATEVTGTIQSIVEDKYAIGVEIKLDSPVNWGGVLYSKYVSLSRKCDDFGNLQYTKLI